MNKAELRKLKKRLKEVPGFRQKINDKVNFSLQYIDFVLNPNDKRFNQEIVDVAFEVLDEFDKEQEEKKAKRLETLNRK